MIQHSKDVKMRMCEQLGENIDAELCEEVARHLEECPDCRAQFDSVEQTVHFYRKVQGGADLPDGARERLYKVLSLDSGSHERKG